MSGGAAAVHATNTKSAAAEDPIVNEICEIAKATKSASAEDPIVYAIHEIAKMAAYEPEMTIIRRFAESVEKNEKEFSFDKPKDTKRFRAGVDRGDREKITTTMAICACYLVITQSGTSRYYISRADGSCRTTLPTLIGFLLGKIGVELALWNTSELSGSYNGNHFHIDTPPPFITEMDDGSEVLHVFDPHAYPKLHRVLYAAGQRICIYID